MTIAEPRGQSNEGNLCVSLKFLRNLLSPFREVSEDNVTLSLGQKRESEQ